ncbi:MAG: hypothetical protein OXG78_07305 [Chloroflexi bacterium]|nr:hypothetical protein [Chloroflexota bacterium]
MKSIAPKDYESLPRLEPPAGYVCVIRDIDSDTYRIEGAAHPGLYIEALLNEEERDFGIELLSILETEDLQATEAELYDLYHARLSGDWLELDPYQLEALRRSILQIDAYASHYLTPQRGPYAKQEMRPKPISRYQRLASSYLRGTSEAEGFRRAYSGPSTYRRYGASSLRRFREVDAEERQVDSDDPFVQILNLSTRISRFFDSDAGKALKFVFFLLLIAVLCMTDAIS